MNSVGTTHLLLLVLQELLLLELVNVLELLELVLLLQGVMMLLKVIAHRPLKPLTRSPRRSTAATWNNKYTLTP